MGLKEEINDKSLYHHVKKFYGLRCSVMAALAVKIPIREAGESSNSSLRIMSGQYASTPLEALQ